MAKSKEEIRIDLIVKAREILKEKGLTFLTARKLSDYSGYSVGTIYNQFKSMDTLIMWENCQTLDELYGALYSVEMKSDAYANLNLLLEKFVDFVFEHKNLWFTLYHFHFTGAAGGSSVFYLKRIVKIIRLLENNLRKLFAFVPGNERRVATDVLFVSLFALSSLLTTDREFARLDKRYVVKLLFNTYLTGVSYLAEQ